MKKIYKIFIVLIILMLPNKVLGATDFSYCIDAYDINIVVNENNTFDITEKITANFHTSKHGIYRKIPLKNTVNRLDGSSTTNRARITHLKVDNEYTTSKSDGNYVIKIGSESNTVIGKQNYTISYNYNIGKDPLKDKDEFYFNIIGNDWDVTIKNITFKITMPKDFDSSTLGFSSGKNGNTTNENINYVVNGNVITGSYNGALASEEALTVRCELPEGYFVNARLGIELLDIIYIVPLIFLIISIIMWYKYGKGDKPVETIEFYPPSGFNSLEVGFLYKGIADSKDVISLLIYLANLGYISIKETKKGFKLRKLKDYDGNNINEKLFLDDLFTRKYIDTSKFQEDDKGRIEIDLLNSDEYKDKYEKTKKLVEVTSEDLYGRFYHTVYKILGDINIQENKEKIFEKNSINKKNIFMWFNTIILFIIIIVPYLYDNNFWNNFINGSINEPKCLIGLIYGTIVIAIIVRIIKIFPKRTAYGNEYLGKIKGFKTFLETAEKEKLEAMVMENPNYFYDILPYTYVLGVSNKWIKKFETISLQAPSWYDSRTNFNVTSFETFMNTTMKSAQNSMTTSASSSSGDSSSSGGGSSGGGSGGGGGGSW